MVGEQLWHSVEEYASMAAGLFFAGHDADVADSVQDAAVMCLQLPEKYPGRPMEELRLIARRAIWNKCIDEKRKKRPIPQSAGAPTENGTHIKSKSDGLFADYLFADRPNERAVEAAEIMAHIESRLLDRDKPIMKMCAEEVSRPEMVARTGRSLRAVAVSLERIRAIARRYDR